MSRITHWLACVVGTLALLACDGQQPGKDPTTRVGAEADVGTTLPDDDGDASEPADAPDADSGTDTEDGQGGDDVLAGDADSDSETSDDNDDAADVESESDANDDGGLASDADDADEGGDHGADAAGGDGSDADPCIDLDGDEHGSGCSGGTDCDDNNSNVWGTCATCRDDDDDGWYVGCDDYATLAGPDCDDTDIDNWLGCATCDDLDGDDWYAGCDDYVFRDGPDCGDVDIDNWQSCASCLDTDSDGRHAGCDAYTTRSGPDCNGTDPGNWVSCATCADNDSDQRFVGCDAYTHRAGPDCNDANATVYQLLQGYRDEDNDTKTVGGAVSICSGATVAAGYRASQGTPTDCNDTDPNNWSSCASCIDNDYDQYYVSCDAYVSRLGPDCNDEGSIYYVSILTYQDADADTYTVGAAEQTCSDGTPPIGRRTSSAGTDCDDTNSLHWSDCDYCVDGDFDGYGAGCQGGYDCNDTEPLVHPGMPEIPDDAVNNDCNGTGDLTANLDGAGVFVAQAGNDAAAGTRAAPVRTLQRALELASAGGRIYVAEGNHSIAGNPSSGGLGTAVDAHIFGGYSVTGGSWTRAADAASFGPVAPNALPTQSVLVGDANTTTTLYVSSAVTSPIVLDRLTVYGGPKAPGPSIALDNNGSVIVRHGNLRGATQAATYGIRNLRQLVMAESAASGGYPTGTIGNGGHGINNFGANANLRVHASWLEAGTGVQTSDWIFGLRNSGAALLVESYVSGGSNQRQTYGVFTSAGTVTLLRTRVHGGWPNGDNPSPAGVRAEGTTIMNIVNSVIYGGVSPLWYYNTRAIYYTGFDANNPTNPKGTMTVINSAVLGGWGSSRAIETQDGNITLINNYIAMGHHSQSTATHKAISAYPTWVDPQTGDPQPTFGLVLRNNRFHSRPSDNWFYRTILERFDLGLGIDNNMTALNACDDNASTGCLDVRDNNYTTCTFSNSPNLDAAISEAGWTSALDIELDAGDAACRDAGMSPQTWYDNNFTDMDGQARPNGLWDIGVDEVY